MLTLFSPTTYFLDKFQFYKRVICKYDSRKHLEINNKKFKNSKAIFVVFLFTWYWLWIAFTSPWKYNSESVALSLLKIKWLPRLIPMSNVLNGYNCSIPGTAAWLEYGNTLRDVGHWASTISNNQVSCDNLIYLIFSNQVLSYWIVVGSDPVQRNSSFWRWEMRTPAGEKIKTWLYSFKSVSHQFYTF